MTAALRDLREDARSRRLLLISLGVLALVFAAIAWFTFAYVRNLWDGRHDIAVDWDPEPTLGQPYRPDDIPSPDGTRFAVRTPNHLVVVDATSRRTVAELGEADEVAWLSEDRLVAFGEGLYGEFEGLAVVDLADQSVEQVDTDGRTEQGFSPVAVTDDGRVEVCALTYDSSASVAICGRDRFLVDPATAELTPA